MELKILNSLLISRCEIKTLSLMRDAVIKYMFGIIACMLFVFSSTVQAEAFPNVKIAIVDVQSVIDNSIAIKHLRVDIDKVSEKFSKELSSKELEFKQMESELVKKRGTLKQEQFDSEVEDFYKKLSAFQHEIQKKKEKLERAHAEAIDLVHSGTIKIVHELAKEKGFNIALPISQTLYADDALNITIEVTHRLNQKVKSVELKY